MYQMRKGEKIQITKRGHVIARLVPESEKVAEKIPDFQARVRRIYGDTVLAVSGAELVSADRSRY